MSLAGYIDTLSDQNYNLQLQLRGLQTEVKLLQYLMLLNVLSHGEREQGQHIIGEWSELIQSVNQGVSEVHSNDQGRQPVPKSHLPRH